MKTELTRICHNGRIANDCHHPKYLKIFCMESSYGKSKLGRPHLHIWLSASGTWRRLTLTWNMDHSKWWNYLQAYLKVCEQFIITAFITKTGLEEKRTKMSKKYHNCLKKQQFDKRSQSIIILNYRMPTTNVNFWEGWR